MCKESRECIGISAFSVYETLQNWVSNLLCMKEDILNEESKFTPRINQFSTYYCAGMLPILKTHLTEASKHTISQQTL